MGTSEYIILSWIGVSLLISGHAMLSANLSKRYASYASALGGVDKRNRCIRDGSMGCSNTKCDLDVDLFDRCENK